MLVEFEQENIKQIEYVLLVGFHHIVGSQVEFVYPPLNEDQEGNLTPQFLQKISQQALPDGSHLQQYGQVYFILNDDKNLYHCVSSFGQIEADLLPQEDSISRTYVQKAVCVLTKVPIYGLLKDKVHMSMQALFFQRNFKETQILKDLYLSSNQFTKSCTLIDDVRDQYIGINLKQILYAPSFAVSHFNLLIFTCLDTDHFEIDAARGQNYCLLVEFIEVELVYILTAGNVSRITHLSILQDKARSEANAFIQSVWATSSNFPFEMPIFANFQFE